MRNRSFKINNGIVRIISGAIMGSFILVGAALAQTSNMNDKKAKRNLVHYTKVAGKDTVRPVDRAANKTVHSTKRGAKGTSKAVDRASRTTARTVKRGSEDMAHYAKAGGNKTGRFFRRVKHATY